MEHPDIRRVLVVDGMPITRFGIVNIIKLHPLLEVCAEAADAPSARELCLVHKPDIAVLDLALPRGDGMDLLKDFRGYSAQIRSLVFTEREDFMSVTRAFKAGASAYVSKRDEGGELLAAFETVLSGASFTSHRVSAGLIANELKSSQRLRTDTAAALLSDKELDVFRRIGQGHGPTAIAAQLGVSLKTVETHIHRIKEKLGLGSSADLRRAAIRWFHRINSDEQSSGMCSSVLGAFIRQ